MGAVVIIQKMFENFNFNFSMSNLEEIHGNVGSVPGK